MPHVASPEQQYVSSPTVSALAGARAYRRLSQEQLAMAAGLGRSTVSRLENGHERPNVDTIRRLATALGLDPSLLFPGNPQHPADEPGAVTTSPRQGRRGEE